MTEKDYMDRLEWKAREIAADVIDDVSLQASFGPFDKTDQLRRLLTEAAFRAVLATPGYKARVA